MVLYSAVSSPLDRSKRLHTTHTTNDILTYNENGSLPQLKSRQLAVSALMTTTTHACVNCLEKPRKLEINKIYKMPLIN